MWLLVYDRFVWTISSLLWIDAFAARFVCYYRYSRVDLLTVLPVLLSFFYVAMATDFYGIMLVTHPISMMVLIKHTHSNANRVF